MPQKRAQLTDDEWHTLLHHVTAEVMTLQKGGRDVLQVCSAEGVDGQSADGSSLESQLQSAATSKGAARTNIQLDDARVKLAV
jgi:hypothetical protein